MGRKLYVYHYAWPVVGLVIDRPRSRILFDPQPFYFNGASSHTHKVTHTHTHTHAHTHACLCRQTYNSVQAKGR